MTAAKMLWCLCVSQAWQLAACGLLAGQTLPQNDQPPQTPAISEAPVDQRSAAAHAEEPSVDAPELLYLTWQPDERDAGGDPLKRAYWRPDGTLISEESMRVHRALPENPSFRFRVLRREEKHLYPLVMVFRVDGDLKNAFLMPTIITDNGQLDRSGAGVFAGGQQLAISASAPSKDAFNRWPEEISIEVKYPLEDPQVIQTLGEMPDEDEVVQVADGVTWYFDASRAAESDPAARRLRPAPNKTAAVLQRILDGSLDLVKYDVQYFLSAEAKQRVFTFSTAIEPDGQMHQIDVWGPLNSKDDLERVEFTRQRFARARIDHVRLRLDLLPAEE